MSYTYEYLEKHFNFFSLKAMLLSLNGVPGTKNKREVIEEIIKIQNGVAVPPRSKRGRPRNETKLANYEMILEDKGVVSVRDHESVGFYREEVSGVFSSMADGSGFIYTTNFSPRGKEVFVPGPYAKKYNLLKGDLVVGKAVKRTNDVYELVEVSTVNDRNPESQPQVKFDQLTAIYPNNQLIVGDSGDLSLRFIDIFAPIARGQRGLIVAPPKSNRLRTIKKIACEIVAKYSDVKVISLLLGGRPEEINDFSSAASGEVAATSFDTEAAVNIRVAELAIARAKRLVEEGCDVVLLIDSISKLYKDYAEIISANENRPIGELSTAALIRIKRLFNTARNAGSASLTILGAINSVSKDFADNVILEELSDSANVEIRLSENYSTFLAPIDLINSETRNDDYIIPESQKYFAEKVRSLVVGNNERLEKLTSFIRETENNQKLYSVQDELLKILN